MVRGKFKLTEIRQVHYGAGKTLVLQAMYDPELPEDRRYAKATPSARLEMHVDNPIALKQFELGADYYLDFTRAE